MRQDLQGAHGKAAASEHRQHGQLTTALTERLSVAFATAGLALPLTPCRLVWRPVMSDGKTRLLDGSTALWWGRQRRRRGRRRRLVWADAQGGELAAVLLAIGGEGAEDADLSVDQ